MSNVWLIIQLLWNSYFGSEFYKGSRLPEINKTFLIMVQVIYRYKVLKTYILH